MILTFMAPSTRHAVGGNATVYELATAMALRGHEVHFYHHPLFGDDAVTSIDEISWYEFRAEMSHHFRGTPELDEIEIVEADFFFGYTPDIEDNPQWGLPLCFVQGHQMYPEAEEIRNLRKPCPKICVASWLVRIGREHGIRAEELVHIPNGLRPDRFHLTRPIEGRPARVLFCYNPHHNKGAPLALEVLRRLHERRPDVEIVGFGARSPDQPLPDWITYHQAPEQSTLVDDLYNGSRIFLWTSTVEGFGLPALEAMACGAALVTTDNGGSEDYAFPDDTALVSGDHEAEGLLGMVEYLLDHEDDRIRIAAAGRRLAAEFTWDRSADRLEQLLASYAAAPRRYGRPG